MTNINQQNVVTFKQIKVACKECSLNEICLPVGIDKNEMNQLDAIMERKRPITRGKHLYNIGDNFRSVFAVRSGSLKTYSTSEDGQEQITGFHFPGELVGLDAIADGCHPLAAKALETTSVCEIPYSKLESLSNDLPGLRKQLFRLMSREIVHDEQNIINLGQRSAEQRLASFLLNISSRFKQRGFSANEFNLPMSRGDIGNYLGLALETASRLFTRFQNDGLITVDRKHIKILDYNQLSDIAGNKYTGHHNVAEN